MVWDKGLVCICDIFVCTAGLILAEDNNVVVASAEDVVTDDVEKSDRMDEGTWRNL